MAYYGKLNVERGYIRHWSYTGGDIGWHYTPKEKVDNPMAMYYRPVELSTQGDPALPVRHKHKRPLKRANKPASVKKTPEIRTFVIGSGLRAMRSYADEDGPITVEHIAPFGFVKRKVEELGAQCSTVVWSRNKQTMYEWN